MISVTPDAPAGSLQLTYGYDSQGRRTGRTFARGTRPAGRGPWPVPLAARYVYDGTQLVGELDQNNVLLTGYTWGLGGQLLAVTDYTQPTPKTYVSVIDASGNTVMLVDPTAGTVAASYVYDSYGNLLTATGPAQAICSILGKGLYYDVEARSIGHASIATCATTVGTNVTRQGKLLAGQTCTNISAAIRSTMLIRAELPTSRSRSSPRRRCGTRRMPRSQPSTRTASEATSSSGTGSSPTSRSRKSLRRCTGRRWRGTGKTNILRSKIHRLYMSRRASRRIRGPTGRERDQILNTLQDNLDKGKASPNTESVVQFYRNNPNASMVTVVGAGCAADNSALAMAVVGMPAGSADIQAMGRVIEGEGAAAEGSLYDVGLAKDLRNTSVPYTQVHHLGRSAKTSSHS